MRLGCATGDEKQDDFRRFFIRLDPPNPRSIFQGSSPCIFIAPRGMKNGILVLVAASQRSMHRGLPKSQDS